MESKILTVNDLEAVLFIHLSDIHFRKGHSNDPYDLDALLRQSLEDDLEEQMRSVGPVTAILVSGDIAYSGHADEYAIAAQWLTNLGQKLGCEAKNILTVPGNHDVQRFFADNDVTLSMYQRNLRACEDSTSLDALLGSLLRNQTAKQKLYEPLHEYNLFARDLSDCDINSENPFWQRNFLLGGVTIRVRGLNSVLVSNSADNNRDQKLLLGSHQSLLRRAKGIEYVTVCHHPPDWLIDQDSVHNNLVSSARLQLFGHKHLQRRERIDDSIRLVAGAVHPDRRERQWNPRYNLIRISVNDEKINYRIYPRIWHEGHSRFGPEYDLHGAPYRVYEFPIANLDSEIDLIGGKPVTVENEPIVVSGASVKETAAFFFDQKMEILMKGAGSQLNDLPPAHRLVARFVDLPAYKREQIVQKLGLAPGETNLTEFEYRKQVFERAVAQNKLGQLWDLVELAHNDGMSQLENPFKESLNEGALNGT